MEEKKTTSERKEKWAAVRGLLLFVLFQLVSGGLYLGLLFWIPDLPGWCRILLATLGILSLAVVFPALWALKERFQEIEGGELDASSKY